MAESPAFPVKLQSNLFGDDKDSKTLKALIEAGAVKSVSIIADGSTVHALVTTGSGEAQPATTLKGVSKHGHYRQCG